MMVPKLAAALSMIATAIVLGGCGLGAGAGTHDASVLVTRDFGTHRIGQVTQRQVPGSETVMQMLERSFHVTTRYGGGFVESINGLSGNASRRDWFFYVNGVEAQKGAAVTPVREGDRIWWDRHDWSAAEAVPAVVGQFPEPFTTGLNGRRYPTVLSCAPGARDACTTVARALTAAHVAVADQFLGTGSGSDSLTIVVGTWRQLHGVIAAELISAGPAKSGVYARFVGPGGSVLELENPQGQAVSTLHHDAGLIAATEQPSLNQPTWLVTGTDAAGVRAAARALTPATLAGHFALAVGGGRTLPIPLQPGQ
jgi:hypothetical protein